MTAVPGSNRIVCIGTHCPVRMNRKINLDVGAYMMYMYIHYMYSYRPYKYHQVGSYLYLYVIHV